jgi:hypothetical protein
VKKEAILYFSLFLLIVYFSSSLNRMTINRLINEDNVLRSLHPHLAKVTFRNSPSSTTPGLPSSNHFSGGTYPFLKARLFGPL